MSGSPDAIPRECAAIDWPSWQPVMRATLLFVFDEEKGILLIRKKRGLGAGKVNAPGGKIDPGESPAECALRETEEEVLVRAHPPAEAGVLHFQFTDGLSIECHVFTSRGHDGTPGETIEAAPFWCPADRIPYEEMWADDRVWLPLLLDGVPFRGYFIFDGETMLDHVIETGECGVRPDAKIR